MYTIYINDRPLTLRGTTEAAPAVSDAATHLSTPYIGKVKTLLHYADMLEKGSPKVQSVDLTATSVEQLWTDFRSHYMWVEAAGGLVAGPEGSHLFIYRRGFWDLPKGKIDAGETRAEAAVREVREETGIQQLELGAALPTTYHTYRSGKGKRILKPTYWFRMVTEERQLTPQAEEDIMRAEWRTIRSVLEAPEPIYASLRTLLGRVVL